MHEHGRPLHVDAADVSRQGWTFVWVVTAAGATHVCLRKVDPLPVYERVKGERITMFCAAPRC